MSCVYTHFHWEAVVPVCPCCVPSVSRLLHQWHVLGDHATLITLGYEVGNGWFSGREMFSGCVRGEDGVTASIISRGVGCALVVFTNTFLLSEVKSSLSFSLSFYLACCLIIILWCTFLHGVPPQHKKPFLKSVTFIFPKLTNYRWIYDLYSSTIRVKKKKMNPGGKLSRPRHCHKLLYTINVEEDTQHREY